MNEVKFSQKQLVGLLYIVLLLNMLHLFAGNVLHVDTVMLGGVFMSLPFLLFLVLPASGSRRPCQAAGNSYLYWFFLLMSIPYLLINIRHNPPESISACVRVIGILFLFHVIRYFPGRFFVALIYRVSLITLLCQLFALGIFLYNPALSQSLFYLSRKTEVDSYDLLSRFSGTVGEINVLPYIILAAVCVLFHRGVQAEYPWLKKRSAKLFLCVFAALCIILTGSRGGGIALLLVLANHYRKNWTMVIGMGGGLVTVLLLWHFFSTEILDLSAVYLGDNNLLFRLLGDSRTRDLAEGSSELRLSGIWEALRIFWEQPFAVRGIFYANQLPSGLLPHCGPVYLLFAYGVFAFYPLYVLLVKNFRFSLRNRTLPIYLTFLVFFLLSVDSFYYFAVPWLTIIIERNFVSQPIQSPNQRVSEVVDPQACG